MNIQSMTFAFLVTIVSLVSIGAWAGPGAHGPNGEHLDNAPVSTGSGLSRLPDGSIRLPKSAQRRLGIRTQVGLVEAHPVSIELNGRIAIDPNRGGRVQAPASGMIEPGPKGLPLPGQKVVKGQVLAFIHHHLHPNDRAIQESTRAELQTNISLLERKLARQEALEGTIPRKEIEATRIELKGSRIRERVIANGLDAHDSLRAPVSGVIASANVLAGQMVEPRDTLFEIVDPEQAIVEATTTDAQIPARIQDARLANALEVTLQFLGAARSLKDGALPLTFRATSHTSVLAVGQPVTVIVRLKDQIKGVLLPAQAVVRNSANEAIVWIKSGAERLIPQSVETIPLDASTIVVTKGLGADNRVVVSGAALVNQIR
ncbi:MAG: HlyD family efflux transporter periplasmic adaptor subunit [Pseudomonadota bacterium]